MEDVVTKADTIYRVSAMMAILMVILFSLIIKVFGRFGGYIGLILCTATLTTFFYCSCKKRSYVTE